MTEPTTQAYEIASRKRRIAAYIIDHFTISIFLISLVFLVLGPNFIDQKEISAISKAMLMIMTPGLFLYLAKDAWRGISLGKWVLGIMVRDGDQLDKVPSLGKLLMRNLFLFIWPIEFIALIASSDKKRIGDKVANTRVVINPAPYPLVPRVAITIVLAMAFFTSVYLFASSSLKNSEAYQMALQEIEQNEMILEKTGGIKGYGWAPTGNIRLNGSSGFAELYIKVIGNDKDTKVRAHLSKEGNGPWEVVELEDMEQ